MENSGEVMGIEDWMRWHVLLCALVFVIPTAFSVGLLQKRRGGGNSSDLWAPCWQNLHPRWLFYYRAFAFVTMAYILYQTVVAFGFFVFFFYTKWTFTLVTVYFAIATVVSFRGCRIHARKANSGSTEKPNEGSSKLEDDEKLGFIENTLQIIYQMSAGASVLADIVFWCLLLPFMTGDDFQLTPSIAYMHSLNAVFLIIDSALNRTPFTWFGMVYFAFWSSSYVVFQWVVHACGVTLWPYPFLDLSTHSLWYLGLALVSHPFYGFYVMLTKAKHATFTRFFPRAFVRFEDKKEV